MDVNHIASGFSDASRTPRVTPSSVERPQGATDPPSFRPTPADVEEPEEPEEKRLRLESPPVPERDVALANELADRMDVAISFHTNDESGGIVIEVTNRETGELIRTIPPEEFHRRMSEFSGFRGLIARASG